jgi:hypothetical protein
MAELLPKGLARAKQAFLTGCSAGGLSTYIHCDDFRALLPKDSTVKCLADGGFFLDVYVLALILSTAVFQYPLPCLSFQHAIHALLHYPFFWTAATSV